MLQIRIRIILGSLIRIPTEVKIQQIWRVKLEPWRAVGAHNEGLEWSLGRSVDQWSQIHITLMSRIRNPVW